MGILVLHFFPKGTRVNPIVIKDGMYLKGSANLVYNSRNIVNRLWVKGGKAVSEPFTQPITVGAVPIPLFYSPREPVAVTIGGMAKTLGVQNIDQPGTHDFLLNASEKLLVPDLCTSGSGSITYCYEYPIKILLEEPASQQKYGIFEDVLNVNTGDKVLALEQGLTYLYKYCQPVLSGSIKPFIGVFKAGEIIGIRIEELGIDTVLKIKEVTYDSVPLKPISINLQLEAPERGIGTILKDMEQRLAKLEKTTYQDDEGPVEKYIAKEEIYSWIEETVKTEPVLAEEFRFWNEDVSYTSHLFSLPSETLYPSDNLFP